MAKYFIGITLFLFTISNINCTKKYFGSKNDNSSYQLQDKIIEGNTYTPPQVIYIDDNLAKSNKDGEMYFDNEYGYRYWRFCDGKYYLDAKYEQNTKITTSKINKKKTKVYN